MLAQVAQPLLQLLAEVENRLVDHPFYDPGLPVLVQLVEHHLALTPELPMLTAGYVKQTAERIAPPGELRDLTAWVLVSAILLSDPEPPDLTDYSGVWSTMDEDEDDERLQVLVTPEWRSFPQPRRAQLISRATGGAILAPADPESAAARFADYCHWLSVFAEGQRSIRHDRAAGRESAREAGPPTPWPDAPAPGW